MQSLRSLAGRTWPIATAAVISLALFWGILAIAERLTAWLLSTVPLMHARGLSPVFFSLLPLVSFFGGFFPIFMAKAARQRKSLTRPKSFSQGF